MAAIVQIIIGLATTFVGFILGFAWHILGQGVVYWRARRFWRPFVSGDVRIVIGRFREFDDFEVSGLVGVGDMQAAAELVSFFGKLGLWAARKPIEIIYHDQLTGDLYGSNLICLGGPDANIVTERLLKRIGCTIAAGDWEAHDVSFRDTRTGDVYSPSKELDRSGREIIALDYGLLVKAPNPFNPECSALICAGSFGYGTWAGIRLTLMADFLREQSVSQGVAIECLLAAEVIEEIPQRPRKVLLRQIMPTTAMTPDGS